MSKFLIFSITAFFVAICIVVIGNYYFISSSVDADWYIKIAQGDINGVLQPFSGRLLHPLTVRLFSFLSDFDINVSFWALNVFLLFGFVIMLSLFFSEISFMNIALVFTLLFSPVLLNYFRYFYFADLFMFFFVILFFYFLKKNNFVFSLLLLFLLLFTRPREAFILGIVLVISSYKSDFKLSVAALLTTITGFFTDYQISLLGEANVNHLSGFVYYILSPIYWFGRFLGIDWLTNTTVQYCQPHFVYSLPGWIKLGSIKWVGICQFNIFHPLSVLFNSFIIFGIIPLMLFFFLYKNWRYIFEKNQIWISTALVYGIIMFFLGSWLGALRTVGYGWPAFLLAALFIFDWRLRMWPDSAKAKLTKAFIFIQITLLWLPYLIVENFSFISNTFKYLLAYLMVFLLYFLFIKMYTITTKKYNIV